MNRRIYISRDEEITERYKKMARKAEEVQRLWRPEPGDRVICKRDIYLRDVGELKEGEVTMILDVEDSVLYVGDVSEIGCYPECIFVPLAECKKEDFIWLPTQEQLQRLVLGPWQAKLHRIHAWFMTEAYERGEHFVSSMTELWLAFVMWDNLHRVWDDEREEWVDKYGQEAGESDEEGGDAE